MNKEIAKQWAAELRSGNYTQGSSFLTRGSLDCCLGVLCKMAVKAGVIPEPIEVEEEQCKVLEYDCTSTADLPRAVMRWAGITHSEGMLPEDYVAPGGSYGQHLSNLNDKGVRFDVIATVIEDNAETL